MKPSVLFAAFGIMGIMLISFGSVRADEFSQNELQPVLKERAQLHDDVILLGDLWDNLDENLARRPAAKAPQPGKRISVDARWLLGIASAHGIKWTPYSMMDRIILDREGRFINTQMVESQIRSMLEDAGVEGPFEMIISNRNTLSLMVPAHETEKFALQDLNLDRARGYFSATLEAPAGGVNAQRVRLSGRLHQTIRIPVLARQVSRGSVISERDIVWVDVRDSGIRDDVALDVVDLIGFEPRRSIKVKTPVRLSELQRPMLVTRNSHVTLILDAPGMQLSAQGKALDEGGYGDVVRVTNLHTKRIVDGVVERNGIVRIFLNPVGIPTDTRIANLGY